MRELLLFTLYAPLAAMGEVAVGERRVSATAPGRSAVLGLIAAGLGIERREEAAHAALDRGYGVAIRVEAQGTLLQDYHTAQVPPRRRGRRWTSRREELAEPRLGTVLSVREYRSDARHTVALWAEDSPPYRIEDVGNALRRPRFTFYFGRKACPLGLPPAPRLVEAGTLADAFARFDADMPEAERVTRAGLDLLPRIGHVRADAAAGPFLGDGLVVRHIGRRRDAVVSRRGWQFGLRDELYAVPSTEPRGPAS